MKVLFFTKYDRLAANTRYRCLQYIPYLQAQGIECSMSPLLDDNYLRFKFSTGKFKFLTVARGYFHRLKELTKVKNYDVVVLHYELFPYFPAFFEWLLDLLKVNYIYDFDDAIFHQYDANHNPLIRFLLKRKIEKVIRHSRAVLAGNQYLASYAQKVANRITIVPTVVDPIVYEPGCVLELKEDPTKPFTIGWIGSPSTVTYVKEKAPALRRFCLKHNAQLVLVGSGPIDIPGVPVIIRDWSEETELEEIRKFDVGIMPLTDDPWSRGKCGFKLIQYMICGLPVVASPVGVNRELVEHGKSGYLATSDAEWEYALEALYQSSSTRREMGVLGREKVIKNYSIQVYAPKVAEILRGTVAAFTEPTHFGNIDLKVAENFGREWASFPQNRLTRAELESIFHEYFRIFPWHLLPRHGGVGADIGCGSGRWALFVAPRVQKLFCVDASHKALEVARRNLKNSSHIVFNHASIADLPFEDESLDFAYSVGVLHHIPDTLAGIQAIARKLKPGAPFLVYIYYAFDNRGTLYKLLWKMSDVARRVISRLPFGLKYWISQLLAISIYWPLARGAKLLAMWKVLPESWTLGYYKDKPFYVMRTDALDRFGTRLEKRFTKSQIEDLLLKSGFKNITFSNSAPYWVAVGVKA
jgi:glycosyltransferase involved in cell wall biosynthesis/ubiquinone/menaquinone biosynthesis C-methylase UbiE